MVKMFCTEHLFVTKVFLLLIIVTLELVARFFEIKWPFVLFFGPILLSCKSSFYEGKYNGWRFLVHSVPFILFSLGLSVFQEFLLPAQVFSLGIYALISLAQKDRAESDGESIHILLVQLAYIDLTISASFLRLMARGYLALDFDISPISIILILLFIKIILIIRYLFVERYWESLLQERQPELQSFVSASRTNLSESLLIDYEARLNQCLIKNKLYLRSRLSLDLLAQEIDIPKHHFSILLNTHIGKSFYQLVAECRINEAVFLMQQGGNSMTIEALAYECGFNSKSSFNKYFKEIVGCLPSEFKDNPNK